MGDFPLLSLILIVGFAAVLVLLVVAMIVTERRARDFATQRGWGYQRTDRQLPNAFPRVAPFGMGSNRNALNVMRYRAGERTGYSFTYRYTTGSGENESSHSFHVVSLDLYHPLPRLILRPETVFSGVSKLLGSQDVQFESEAFNRAWIVQSEYLPAAHDILHPRMMEWLLGVERLNIVIEDQTMFLSVLGEQKLDRIEGFISFLLRFESEIPHFVWQKAQGEYPRPDRRRGFWS